jgi:hypothetical protein
MRFLRRYLIAYECPEIHQFSGILFCSLCTYVWHFLHSWKSIMSRFVGAVLLYMYIWMLANHQGIFQCTLTSASRMEWIGKRNGLETYIDFSIPLALGMTVEQSCLQFDLHDHTLKYIHCAYCHLQSAVESQCSYMILLIKPKILFPQITALSICYVCFKENDLLGCYSM